MSSALRKKTEDNNQIERQRAYTELIDTWVNSYVPQTQHPSHKTFHSADCLISALEPIIMRPNNNSTDVRLMPALLLRLSDDVLIRAFYNFSNKFGTFREFVGMNMNAFGSTLEATDVLGIRDVVFSHVYARGETTTGCKVRATLVAFKVHLSKTQLPQVLSHPHYWDIIADPYCDAATCTGNPVMKKVLGLERTQGKIGDYYENENLSARAFPKIINEAVRSKFDEIENHLKTRTEACSRIIKERLGL